MDAFLSFINGFIYTALLFFLCLIFTVGVKWLYLSLKSRFYIKPKAEKVQPPKPAEQKPPEQKKPAKKPTRTIEINADDVDKIYFKKSS